MPSQIPLKRSEEVPPAVTLPPEHSLSHSPWITWMSLAKAEMAGVVYSAHSSPGLGKGTTAFQPWHCWGKVSLCCRGTFTHHCSTGRVEFRLETHLRCGSALLLTLERQKAAQADHNPLYVLGLTCYCCPKYRDMTAIS